MQTIMFRKGKVCLVADIFNVVIEPLGNSRQVVFFCRDSSGNKYRVPKSEVVAKCVGQPISNGKKEKKRKRCCA